MKTIFNFCVIGFSTIFLTSCGPEPTTANRKFTGSEGGGPPTMGKVSPLETIYCTVSGKNCGDYVGSGDVVVFERQSQLYSDFIADCHSDSLARFFRMNDWHELFGAVDREGQIDQNAIDKIISKEYAVQVALDSSIVIYDNNTIFTTGNVLFAIKK